MGGESSDWDDDNDWNDKLISVESSPVLRAQHHTADLAAPPDTTQTLMTAVQQGRQDEQPSRAAANGATGDGATRQQRRSALAIAGGAYARQQAANGIAPLPAVDHPTLGFAAPAAAPVRALDAWTRLDRLARRPGGRQQLHGQRALGEGSGFKLPGVRNKPSDGASAPCSTSDGAPLGVRGLVCRIHEVCDSLRAPAELPSPRGFATKTPLPAAELLDTTLAHLGASSQWHGGAASLLRVDFLSAATRLLRPQHLDDNDRIRLLRGILSIRGSCTLIRVRVRGPVLDRLAYSRCWHCLHPTNLSYALHDGQGISSLST